MGGTRSEPEQFLSFLAKKADTTFRPNAIAQQVDSPNNSTHADFKRIEYRDQVRH